MKKKKEKIGKRGSFSRKKKKGKQGIKFWQKTLLEKKERKEEIF